MQLNSEAQNHKHKGQRTFSVSGFGAGCGLFHIIAILIMKYIAYNYLLLGSVYKYKNTKGEV
jgi:hypothetical protein